MGTRARLRVAQVAKKQGVGIRELARRADLYYPTVHQVWHNTGNPTIETITKIADALGVPVTDLFDGDERIET